MRWLMGKELRYAEWWKGQKGWQWAVWWHAMAEREGERWWCDVVKRKVRVLVCARERGEVVKLKR